MAPAPASRKKTTRSKGDASDMSTEEAGVGKVVPKGDASDATDAMTAAEIEPPKAGRRLRHTDSELSSTDLEELEQAGSSKGSGKRFKLGSPKSRRAGAAAAADVAAPVVRERLADVVAAASGAGRASSAVGRSHKEVISSAKAITQELMEVVLLDGVDPILAKKVLENAAKFEALVFGLMAENERVRGKLEVLQAGSQSVFKTPAVPSAVPVRRPPVSSQPVVAAAAIPKPVELWSVMVKGKGVSSKEVVDKVVSEVGPTLGVRVHELRPLKSGGAVLRTPSVAEREKVAANAKFGEVGLEVSVQDKLGPKVVVQRVHAEISADDFMQELYELNFRRRMTPEQFKKSVRMVTSPWKPTGGSVTVVLEGSNEAMQQLLDNGRCYIKWFSFLVRPHDAVPSCFRCLSFDHRVKECRMAEGVCRLCGQAGHMASRCVNAIHCRNCSFKGLPADHLMMSAACPVYSAMVARVNARH